tara:strand:- start:60 stop:575 length:516 start_codon:yes stop_codon:yes gene_type:complete
MTSIGPYTQTLNFTHMFDIQDLRGERKPQVCPGSLLAIIDDKNNDFSLYSFVVKLAGLNLELTEPQANFTLFIPTDTVLKEKNLEHYILNMDRLSARDFILSSMLNNKITTDLLMISKACKFITRKQPYDLNVLCVDDKIIINGRARLIEKDLEAVNGLIHVVDNVLFPLV